MKFGVNILNFGPEATPANLRRWAEYAEQSGYDFCMISDHVALTPDVARQYPAPFYDPFTVLAWLAAITSRVEIGTTVAILPYRHPLQVARVAANIDQLSGGRLILGVGAGWAKEEFTALGARFDRRSAISDEYLAVIRACWTNETVSHAGKFVSFTNVETGPAPRRIPPIWVGGSSDGAIRRAVRYGDAWHPIRPRLDWLRNEGLPRLRAAAEREQRPVPALCPRLNLRITASALTDSERTAGQGTLAQIGSDLDALRELGAESVLFDTFTGNARDPQIDPGLRMLDEVSKLRAR